MALVTLLVVACAVPGQQPTPTQPPATPPPTATAEPSPIPPTATVVSTDTPSATEEAAADSTPQVGEQPTETREIMALGLRFELPEDFQGMPSDLDGQMAYVSRRAPGIQVGVMWRDLEPPMEPEAALLPTPSRVLASDPFEAPWGNGRVVTLELLGAAEEGQEAPVVAVSRHVLVVRTEDGGRRAVDFFLRAPDEQQLEAYVGLLDGMLDTAEFIE